MILVTLLALCGKLFTYEFVLRDDPTSGIALRSTPSFANGPTLLDSGSVILLQDENGFEGEELYRAFAHFGWIICIAFALAAVWTLRKQRG